MRRLTLAVLPMLLCLLCACSGKGKTMQAQKDFRARLCAAGSCSFRLEASEDFDGRVCDFTLDCVCGTDGSSELTVVFPESVAGVRARTEGESGELIYGETVLTFGFAPDARLAPLSVTATLVRAWSGGDLASSGPDGDETCAVYELGYDGEQISVYTWFSPDGTPSRAELALGGAVLCRAKLADFHYAGGNNEAAETNLG